MLGIYILPTNITDEDIAKFNEFKKDFKFTKIKDGTIKRVESLTLNHDSEHAIKQGSGTDTSRARGRGMGMKDAQRYINAAIFMIDQGDNSENQNHEYTYVAVQVANPNATDLKNACVVTGVTATVKSRITGWYFPDSRTDTEFAGFMKKVIQYLQDKK